MAPVYIGLIHYPIYNKHMEVVTTALTNYDLHDIARTAKTYDVKRYFIVHPVEAQREMASRIMNHWKTTDARVYPNTVSYTEMRRKIHEEDTPIFILFGTGFGMTKEMMKQFDYIVEPIYGAGTYNHLCVRSAVAIILDRLLGEPWWNQKEE